MKVTLSVVVLCVIGQLGDSFLTSGLGGGLVGTPSSSCCCCCCLPSVQAAPAPVPTTTPQPVFMPIPVPVPCCPCPAPQQQQPQVVQQPQATQQPQVVIQVQQPTAQQPQVMLPAPPLVQQPQIMVAAPQQVAPQIMLPQIVQPQILPQLPFQQQQCNCNLIGTIQIPDASVAGAPIAAPSIMAGAQCRKFLKKKLSESLTNYSSSTKQILYTVFRSLSNQQILVEVTKYNSRSLLFTSWEFVTVVHFGLPSPSGRTVLKRGSNAKKDEDCELQVFKQ
ncbi:hypothetical protein NECAME_12499 [Necator americanus]|uniref:Uncharacterized protein n=1 Tax=Necator americanus TaxID=51031 RepID=W2T259_NECAM|nr:hypothetical protein NECAME_12499 [Necator americanus]ETN75291.1 hypothetical protein NECAME_12499 [Necator americanus]